MSADAPPDQAGSGEITLAAAAERLGVHYMTAYRYVRTGRMHAVKRGGKWWVTEAEAEAVLLEGTGPRARAAVAGPRVHLVEEFTARLIVADGAGCWDLITDALAAGASPVEVHEKLLHAALTEIGDRWSRAELSVADEHRATVTAQRLIGQMSPLFRHRGRRRGTVVLGTVSGDYHSLPTALLADHLCDRRFEVIDLGGNTPATSFVDAALSVDDLVGVGVCAVMADGVDAAHDTLVTLREVRPDTLLIAGGAGIVADVSGSVHTVADQVTLTADQACQAFEAALRGRPGSRGDRSA